MKLPLILTKQNDYEIEKEELSRFVRKLKITISEGSVRLTVGLFLFSHSWDSSIEAASLPLPVRLFHAVYVLEIIEALNGLLFSDSRGV